MATANPAANVAKVATREIVSDWGVRTIAKGVEGAEKLRARLGYRTRPVDHASMGRDPPVFSVPNVVLHPNLPALLHTVRTGQTPHFGDRALHTSAPSSMSA